MRSLLYSVLLTFCVLLSQAATLPHSSLIQISTLNGTRHTLVPPPESLKIATRQLPEHDCALHITYQYTRRLPEVEWRFALTRAQLYIQHNLAIYGDEGPVLDDISVAETTVIFAAESDRHSPTVELTYGILEEVWTVLVDFVEGRPHPLRAWILDGMDGKGPPLGYMLLVRYRGSSMLNSTRES